VDRLETGAPITPPPTRTPSGQGGHLPAQRFDLRAEDVRPAGMPLSLSDLFFHVPICDFTRWAVHRLVASLITPFWVGGIIKKKTKKIIAHCQFILGTRNQFGLAPCINGGFLGRLPDSS